MKESIAVRTTSYKETLEHFEIGKVLIDMIQVKFVYELCSVSKYFLTLNLN